MAEKKKNNKNKNNIQNKEPMHHVSVFSFRRDDAGKKHSNETPNRGMEFVKIRRVMARLDHQMKLENERLRRGRAN